METVMTKELEYQLINRRVKELFNISLKDLQTQAIHHLLMRNSDLILIAKTGFGKTVIIIHRPSAERLGRGDIPMVCVK
jgi:superfamily II DNA or RNA helicase